MRIGRRAARVAPARTVLVAAAGDNANFAGGRKPLAEVREVRMASNGTGEEEEVEMETDLSPDNNGTQ